MMAGSWSRARDDGGGAARMAAGRLVVLVVRVCGAMWCNDNQSM